MEHFDLVTPDGPIAVTYLTRHDWGAGPVTAGHPIPVDQPSGWVLHHTVSVLRDWDGDGILHGDLDDIVRYMRQLQAARPDLGGEVPYSVVPFKGTNDRHAVIVEGRGPGRTGAHTAGLNSTRYAWSLPGDYRTETPSIGQVWGMRWIAHRWTPRASAPTIGHRQAPPYWSGGTNLNATACPGRLDPVARLQPPFLPLDSPEVDEMTPAQMDELKRYIDERISTLDKRVLDHVNGVNDGVKAEVERLAKKGREHARTMAESVISRLPGQG